MSQDCEMANNNCEDTPYDGEMNEDAFSTAPPEIKPLHIDLSRNPEGTNHN